MFGDQTWILNSKLKIAFLLPLPGSRKALKITLTGAKSKSSRTMFKIQYTPSMTPYYYPDFFTFEVIAKWSMSKMHHTL